MEEEKGGNEKEARLTTEFCSLGKNTHTKKVHVYRLKGRSREKGRDYRWPGGRMEAERNSEG